MYDYEKNRLKVKNSGYYDIEAKISYILGCGLSSVPISKIFPEGITIYISSVYQYTQTSSITFNNTNYNSINSLTILIVVIGNKNFGMFRLFDTNTNDVINGTFSSTNISGNLLIPGSNITLTGGIINGCAVKQNSSMVNSIGVINNLYFNSGSAVVIDPTTLVTLSYNGQVILPYEPQIGLFNNDKLIFKTGLTSLKMNKVQVLCMILLQLASIASFDTTFFSFSPIFITTSLIHLFLMFPPPFLPELPDIYIVADNAEVVLGTKAKLEKSDILTVKQLCPDNSFKLIFLCKGSNIILNNVCD